MRKLNVSTPTAPTFFIVDTNVVRLVDSHTIGKGFDVMFTVESPTGMFVIPSTAKTSIAASDFALAA